MNGNEKADVIQQGIRDAVLRTKLIEYRDSLYSTKGQLLLVADTLEKRGFDGNELRDGAKLYGLIADDLTKIINGEELSRFEVTGVVP